MHEIDRYKKVFGEDLRTVWHALSATVSRLKGSLVGGSALATILEHRQSFDLDYHTTVGFSGKHLGKKLMRYSNKQGLSCVIKHGETDMMTATVNGVGIDVFRTIPRGSNPGYEKQLASHNIIDGLRVASLPDLFAMKLDAIMYRPKLRDYIDIVAIDRSRILTIEDDLALHAERYGVPIYGHDATQILRLLKAPGKLSPDRIFDDEAVEKLSYLKQKAEEVSHTIARSKTSFIENRNKPPRPLPIDPVQTAKRCGAWMPIAQTRCQLPKGHRGHHRSISKTLKRRN